MDVILSEQAFMGLLVSSVEVFKKECLGILLGYNLRGKIYVEYVIPSQSAERDYNGVIPNARREKRVTELLPQLTHFSHIGYYHSHPDSVEKLSDPDKESMLEELIEIVVSISKAKRKDAWGSTRNTIYGTLGDYRFRLASYYKSAKGDITQKPLLCPYAIGFKSTYEN